MPDLDMPRRVHGSLIFRRSYKGIFSLPVLFGVGGIWQADEDWAKPIDFAPLGVSTDLKTLAIAALVMLILVRIGASVLFAFLNWRRLTYSIDGSALTIRSGRLFKRERVIPLSQIQNIEIERSPLDRLFATALVKVEVASGAADEGTLESLPLTEVARLHAAAGHPLPDTLQSITDESAPVLLQLGKARLFFAGLFGWWIAGAALLLPLADPILKRLRGEDDAGRLLDRLKSFAGDFSWGETIALLVAGTALLLLFASMASVVVNYGFRIVRQGEALRLTKGLLQTRERLIPLDRVRGISLTEVRIGGLSGWNKLEIRLQDSTKGDSSFVLAPLARGRELVPILSALNFVAPDEAGFTGSRRTYALLHALELPLAILSMLLLPLGVLFFAERDWFALAAGAALVLFLICVIAEALRLLTHQHQLSGDRLYLRHGKLLRRTVLVRMTDVQGRIVTQSFTDRILGLAAVTFDVPGISGLLRTVVPGVDVGRAYALASRVPEQRSSAARDGKPREHMAVA